VKLDARRARVLADREYSTKDRASVRVSTRPGRSTSSNTNGLVRAHRWDVSCPKTGYISEAGRCLVMRVKLASRDLIVVLLDSWGRQSRLGDANRVKKWVETNATGVGAARRPSGSLAALSLLTSPP